MPGLDNKISNVIATQLPSWLIKQLNTRANQNSKSFRDNDNLKYLANKTGWIRVISSIDISKNSEQSKDTSFPGIFSGDMKYFSELTGLNLQSQSDLAKNFILYGGVSKYNKQQNSVGFSYNLKSGLGLGGSYGVLGEEEIKNFGYRPIPGITDATIETMGRLGSVRLATINFKVSDKSQLDIIDALYFKLGYSILIEWGNTTYYSEVPGTEEKQLRDTELLCIDPFRDNLTKEQINSEIYSRCRESEGNYDAMLGIVSNYNFSMNQEGGYDCSIKVVSLGVLGDSIKANQNSELPDLIIKEVKQYFNNLRKIEEQKQKEEEFRIRQQNAKDFESKQNALGIKTSLNSYLGIGVNSNDPNINTRSIRQNTDLVRQNSYLPSNKNINSDLLLYGDQIVSYEQNKPEVFIVRKDGLALLPDDQDNFEQLIESVQTNPNQIKKLFDSITDQKSYSRERLGFLENSIAVYNNTDSALVYFLYSQEGNTDIQSQVNTGVIKKYLARLDFTAFNTINSPSGINKYYNYLDWIKKDLTTNQKKIDSKNITVSIKDKSYLQNQIYRKNTPSNSSDIPDNYYTNNINSNIDFITTSNNKVVEITIKSEVLIPVIRTTQQNNETEDIPSILPESSLPELQNQNTTTKKVIYKKLPYKLTFYESGLIESIKPNEKVAAEKGFLFLEYLKNQEEQSNKSKIPEQQNQVDQINENQIRQTLAYQSSLELVLKAIQLYSINNTLLPGVNFQGKTVHPVKIMDKKNKPFYDSIFSMGVFSKFKDELYDTKNVDIKNYPNRNRFDNLKIQAKFGFNSSVMLMEESKDDFSSIKPVDFKTLLTSYVIPYDISQTVVEGTSINHPVYIPFGFLLMLLNNMCVLYDSKKSSDVLDQVPLVYIDFHPETNFCLSAPEHLSVNVKQFLIPFQGTNLSYSKLFNEKILNSNKTSILPPSGSNSDIPLFNPVLEDGISGIIPPFKFSTNSPNLDYQIINSLDGASGYRGKIMNVLINIEYILETIKTFTSQNGSNDVYIKPFIEKILSDMNKSFGDFNVFRLSYNDYSNTFTIVDDQYTPGVVGEQIQKTDVENRTELPIYGKFSIAKNLELRSEVSSRLSSMIAISSNADAKYAMSTDATSYGFINSNYQDRYINNKTEITVNQRDSRDSLDSIKNSAIMFNQTIKSYYSTTNPSDDSLGHAINYYIEKMSKIKAEGPTKSSVLIPLSLNFTIDGISGFRIGSAFTISDKFLPYTYNQRLVTSPVKQKVGFCVVGVTHNISENVWNTSIKSHMIYLKDYTDFKSELNQSFNASELQQNPIELQSIGNTIIPSDSKNNVRTAVRFLLGSGYNKFAVAALVGGFIQESQMNPNAVNNLGAVGIAQWLDRKNNLINYSRSINSQYNNLDAQLKFVVYELNGSESNVKNQLLLSSNLEQAIQAAANYERFQGFNKGLGVGLEWGKRIQYSKQILNDIESGIYT